MDKQERRGSFGKLITRDSYIINWTGSFGPSIEEENGGSSPVESDEDPQLNDGEDSGPDIHQLYEVHMNNIIPKL